MAQLEVHAVQPDRNPRPNRTQEESRRCGL